MRLLQLYGLDVAETAVAFIAAVWLATSSPRSMPVPFAGIATVALIGAGIVLSGSVGSLVAASVGAGAYLALSRPSLRLILLAAVIAAPVPPGRTRLRADPAADD